VLIAVAALGGFLALVLSNDRTTTVGEVNDRTTTVGEVFAEAELKPVGDSEVLGTVSFKDLGTPGVVVELDTSHLPKPEATYYAQIHEGNCTSMGVGGEYAGHANEQENGEDHAHQQALGNISPSIAMVSFDWLLITEAHAYALGAHDPNAPTVDELPGNIDQPMGWMSSYDGTGSVTSVLEGVTPEQILSGEPKYLDVHSTDPEDAKALACADLNKALTNGGPVINRIAPQRLS
jgi:hypothetical protein